MADFSQMSMPCVSIHSWTPFGPIGLTRGLGVTLTPASIAWSAANRAVYMPHVVPHDFPVERVFWTNGSSTTGTGAFGIYTLGGSLIYATPSTAKAGASVLQFITPTSFILPKGTYYFAVVMSATTNAATGSTTPTTPLGRMMGLLQQDVGSTTLPTTMTPAQWTGTAYPLAGITRLL